MLKPILLPYDYSSLNPIISTQTMQFHFDKHYLGYINKTNELIKDSALDKLSVKDLVVFTGAESGYSKIFNQAAQVWNHEFYWQSLTNDEGKRYLSDTLLKKITDEFGSVNELKSQILLEGMNFFGSGWIWLVLKEGKLALLTTVNAQTPLTDSSLTPLLCIDLWEHAYYLDWQNLRKDYLQGVLDNLINWQFASNNFDLS